MSANLYKTKNPEEFYHIHGSLEATTTLNMIGLEGHRSDLTDYEDIIKVIESHVEQYTVPELEKMNKDRRQAGVPALKYEDFIQTPHVRYLLPLLTLARLNTSKLTCITGQVERRTATVEIKAA